MNIFNRAISYYYNKNIAKDLNLVKDLLGEIDLMPNFTHDYRHLCDNVVNRSEFLIEESTSKSVLHFGFLDSPFFEEKINNNNLLHQQIKSVCANLFGVDINQKDLTAYRELTGDFANKIINIETEDLPDLDFWGSNYDIILFPEVLEHIPNPGLVCRNLKKISELNNNAKVIFTLPNAFNYSCFKTALRGWEFQHPEHFHYYSPLTIKNMLIYAGFQNYEIFFCTADMNKLEPGLTKFGIIAVAS
jgi:hypothetical protein